jgi:peptide/nickel transport system permease protein
VAATPLPALSAPVEYRRRRARSLAAYCRRNPQLLVGAGLILFLVLFGLAGRVFVNVGDAVATSALPSQPPSRGHLLGTDSQGRDLLAVMVVGIPLTLWVGLIAGAVGVGVGVVLALVAGFRGGAVDAVIRTVVDSLLTVPGLLVLVVITASIKGVISINVMALVIASLAWPHPTRTVRAQVLTLRERSYLHVARFSGMHPLEVVFRELLPNLLPYIAASFVGAVAAAVLATVGLEALGLGPQNESDLGMTIHWAIYYAALIRGMWWWWLPPIVAVVLLFLGLYLMSAGLDEFANPRRRRAG